MKYIAAFILAVCPLVLFIVYPKQAPSADDVFVDNFENIYFVSYLKNTIEIYKTSPAGKLMKTWDTARYDKYDYIEIKDMCFSPDGRAFCVLSQVDSRDYGLTRLYALEIDFSSGKSSVLDGQCFETDEEPTSARLYYADNNLRLVCVYSDCVAQKSYNLTDNTNKTDITDVSFTSNLNYAYLRGDGSVILTNRNGEIYKLQPNGQYSRIYSEKAGSYARLLVSDRVYAFMINEKKWMEIDENGAAHGAGIPQYSNISASGNIFFRLDGQRAAIYKNNQTKLIPMPKISPVFEVILFVGLGVVISAAFLILTMKKRKMAISLLFKQAAVIIAALSAAAVILSIICTDMLEKNHEDKRISEALQAAQIFSARLDLEKLAAIGLSDPKRSPYLDEVKDLMDYQIKTLNLVKDDSSPRQIFQNAYLCFLIASDGAWHTAVYDEKYVNVPIEYVLSDSVCNRFNAFFSDGRYDGCILGFDDSDGLWISVTIPVLDQNNNLLALAEAGFSKREYIYEVEQSVRGIMYSVLLSVSLVATLLLLGLSFSLRRLKKLRYAVEAAGQGDYSIAVTVKGRDEVAAISKAFNNMSRQIEQHTLYLQELNRAYFRFLPSELLSILGKQDVLLIKRGDYSRIRSYILHIYLTDFTKSIENLNEHDAFELINRMCNDVIELVLGGGGVIESYSTEAFVCLFESPETAVGVAVSISRLCNELNKTLISKIIMRMVLLEGELLLGVAGHEKRLGTVMLSEQMKLSQKLGKIGDLYNARIILMEEMSGGWKYRYLGKICFEGKRVDIYDCYEGDEHHDYLNKLKNTELFEQGIELFESKNWETSKQIFIKYLRTAAQDEAVKQYLFLCENNLRKPENIKGFGD